MEREIKFRVWNQKEMLYLNDEQFITFGNSGYFSIEDHSNENFDNSESFNGHKDLNIMNSLEDDLVLMQYTGLEDVNGSLWYEGEIILNTDRKEFGVISYSNEQAMFVVKYAITEDEYPASVSVSNLYYSVGNIYEHSHLLNKEQSVKESDTSKAT